MLLPPVSTAVASALDVSVTDLLNTPPKQHPAVGHFDMEEACGRLPRPPEVTAIDGKGNHGQTTKAKAEAEAAAETLRTKAEAIVTVEPGLHRSVAFGAEGKTPIPAEVCSHQPPVAGLTTHARATSGGLSSSTPALTTVIPPATVAPVLDSLGEQGKVKSKVARIVFFYKGSQAVFRQEYPKPYQTNSVSSVP